MGHQVYSKFKFDALAQTHSDELLERIEQSERYTVTEKENAYEIYRLNDNNKAIVQGIHIPKESTTFLKLYKTEYEQEEREHLRDVLGDEFSENIQTIRKYKRKLQNVDEGNAEQFVKQLAKEIGKLGYNVTTERSLGTWIREKENETDVLNEYKWWFYILESDDPEDIAPHNLDLYFTEDGIEIRGYVTVGTDNQSEFEQFLTEFTHK